jgi:hypothetical protein
MNSGEDAVIAMLDLLNREGVDYMIVGSFSYNRYGVPRAIQDADIVIAGEKRISPGFFSRLPAAAR